MTDVLEQWSTSIQNNWKSILFKCSLYHGCFLIIIGIYSTDTLNAWINVYSGG